MSELKLSESLLLVSGSMTKGLTAAGCGCWINTSSSSTLALPGLCCGGGSGANCWETTGAGTGETATKCNCWAISGVTNGVVGGMEVSSFVPELGAVVLEMVRVVFQ